MLRKIILQVALCVAILFGAVTGTQAAFTVTVKIDGKTVDTFTDNSGTVEFYSNVFSDKAKSNLVVTVNSNSLDSTNPGQITTTISGTRSKTDKDYKSIEVDVVDTRFLVPTPGPVTISSQLGTSSTPSATYAFATTVDGNPTVLANNIVPGTLTNNPYTISNVLTASALASGNFSNNGTSEVTAVVPVPPALALLASGLPFALVYLRRRKQA